MLNPQASSKSPISSRIALPVALMMAGIFGLAISMVQPPQVAQSPAPAPEPTRAEPAVAETEKESLDEGPAPKSEDLVAFCSKHVTDKRSFVVFKRGTCVVINEPCEDPLKEAKQILARCKDPNARFVSEPTNEGDLIVTFKDPVFLRFSPAEMLKLHPWLEKSAVALLSPAESVSAGEGWVPPKDARVGLLARRRMLEDATSTVPVKIIRAKENGIAAR